MRVYVASPYTLGDRSENVRKALAVATQLLDAGHEPFCPLLSHFWDLMYPRPWHRWMEVDLAWLKVAEALVRIPGESVGADREVAVANRRGIPTFFSVEAFLEWANERKSDG